LKIASPDAKPVLAKSNGRCWYCGVDKPSTIDHMLPKSRGGRNHVSNYVAACRPCNAMKSNLTVEEFRQQMKAYGAKRVVFYGEKIQPQTSKTRRFTVLGYEISISRFSHVATKLPNVQAAIA
jgi:hypothetical protein